MMDLIWYVAYIPVFLIGVLAGFTSGLVSGERAARESRADKNKKCRGDECK